MTRLLFLFLPLSLLLLSLIFALSVSAQGSTPECPLDPVACSHPCRCSGENYGGCDSKGMICGLTKDEDGPWKCIEGSRPTGYPTCQSSSRPWNGSRGRGIPSRGTRGGGRGGGGRGGGRMGRWKA